MWLTSPRWALPACWMAQKRTPSSVVHNKSVHWRDPIDDLATFDQLDGVGFVRYHLPTGLHHSRPR